MKEPGGVLILSSCIFALFTITINLRSDWQLVATINKQINQQQQKKKKTKTGISALKFLTCPNQGFSISY